MATATKFEYPDPSLRMLEAAPSAITSAPEKVEELDGEKMVLNMGPSHPATHGVLRLVLELDGEVITKATPDIGYLHRGDEKIAENMTFTQFIPYTDRLDYLAPLANNVAYALAVEKLLGIDQNLTPRCQYIRVICCELARLSAHLLGLGCMALDLGAMTERQDRHSLMNLCGSPMTPNPASQRWPLCCCCVRPDSWRFMPPPAQPTLAARA